MKQEKLKRTCEICGEETRYKRFCGFHYARFVKGKDMTAPKMDRSELGRLGGLAKNKNKGFGSNPERAKLAGHKGGLAKKSNESIKEPVQQTVS